jgi:hypothetical protein
MAEREDIETFTGLFRTDTDPFWIRLREVVRERGIEPSTSLLVFSVEDDINFEFGVIVTHDRRVIQFGFRYTESVADGKLTEWKDLTERWATSPYRSDVSTGLSLLEKVA